MGEHKLNKNVVHLQPPSVDPLKTISKNDLYRILVDTQTMLFEMRADIEKIKNVHTEEIRKEIDKQFGERIKYVDAVLADVIVQKELFYEKGIITRQEMTQKLNDMRSAKR
jgi:hypothetical protein